MGLLRGIAATALVSLALVACGGGGGGNGNGDGGDGDGGTAGTTLVMVDNAFQPTGLTVSAGSELEVSNEGQVIHNFTIEDADVDVNVEAGQSTTVTVDAEPGEYDMVCSFHVSLGMEGTITVE